MRPRNAQEAKQQIEQLRMDEQDFLIKVASDTTDTTANFNHVFGSVLPVFTNPENVTTPQLLGIIELIPETMRRQLFDFRPEAIKDGICLALMVMNIPDIEDKKTLVMAHEEKIQTSQEQQAIQNKFKHSDWTDILIRLENRRAAAVIAEQETQKAEEEMEAVEEIDADRPAPNEIQQVAQANHPHLQSLRGLFSSTYYQVRDAVSSVWNNNTKAEADTPKPN